jgi:hypothetical protein
MLYRLGKAVNDTIMQNFGAYFFHQGGNFFSEDFTMPTGSGILPK